MNNAVNVNWKEKEERLADLVEPAVIAYLYILSVVAPYIGLVLGIALMTKAELEKDRQLGKNCTVISSIMLGLLLVCCVIYALMYVFVGLMVLSYAMVHAPPA